MAGILSFIQPGLGHVYNGEICKALIIYILPFLLLSLLIFGLYTRFAVYYLALFTLLILAYYVLVVFDAIRIARISNTVYPLKKYNKVIICIERVLLLAVIIRVSVQGFIKNFTIRTYKLSAVSMEPTLLAGDYILVDLRKGAKNPKKDLIIFEYPKDPSNDFVKHVVAVSGDTVEIKDNNLS